MTDRVGILLVHGIQQQEIDPLDDLTANIKKALEVNKSLEVNLPIDDEALAAEKKAHYAGAKAPYILEVKDSQNNVTKLEFSSVRWSDLDESETPRNKFSFWVRVLSIWTDLKLFSIDQVKVFLTSVITLLVAPSLYLVSWIARQIFGVATIRPDILFPISAIKLVHPQRRAIKDLLPSLLKRRMRLVRSLVNMSLRDYDRWYILSHDKGNVIAFNGLMETEQALPNYLDRDLWKKWAQRHQTKAETRLSKKEIEKMLLPRHDWLQDSDIISRKDLFAKLRGFMNYGSPLYYFAILWPELVLLNIDESVFDDDFEWLNIYDPSDPVAAKTKYFEPNTPYGPQTQDISYKAPLFHLFSHIKYFDFNPKKNNRLVNKVSSWLLNNEKFEYSRSGCSEWPNAFFTSFYWILCQVTWGILALIIPFCLSCLIPWSIGLLFPSSLSYYIDFLDIHIYIYQILSNSLFYIILSVFIVIISGMIRTFFFGKKDEQNKLLNSNQSGVRIIIAPSSARFSEEIDWELQQAKDLLFNLLPPEEALYGLDLSYRLVPATTISGDYVNYMKRENNSFGIYLVDVEGHGLAAALQVSNLYQLLYREVEDKKWGMDSPQKELKKVDIWVKKSDFFQKQEAVFCMNFTEINLNTMKLRHANAAMPFPLLFRSGKTEPEIIETSGFYVGTGHDDFKEIEVNIEKGDLLVIFSDGITEAINSRGQIFGQSGIKEAVVTNRNKSPKEIAEQIIMAVKKHSGREKPEDDQTIVVILIGESPNE